MRFALPSACCFSFCFGFGLGPFWAWRYFRLFAVGSEFALNFRFFCFMLDFLFPDFALLLRHFDGASDAGDDNDDADYVDDDDACSAPTMLSSWLPQQGCVLLCCLPPSLPEFCATIVPLLAFMLFCLCPSLPSSLRCLRLILFSSFAALLSFPLLSCCPVFFPLHFSSHSAFVLIFVASFGQFSHDSPPCCVFSAASSPSALSALLLCPFLAALPLFRFCCRNNYYIYS